MRKQCNSRTVNVTKEQGSSGEAWALLGSLQERSGYGSRRPGGRDSDL